MKRGGRAAQDRFFRKVGVTQATFTDAADAIGGRIKNPGLRFFDLSGQGVAFGPGAGLVLGVSVGASSLRAALVDANGRLFHHHPADSWHEQRHAPPEEVLGRIREAAEAVLTPALADPALLVGDELPLLGVAVAWPSGVDRRQRPAGLGLSHPRWKGSQTLTQRVARHLGIPPARSHALNDAHAAALAVAFHHTQRDQHVKQQHPHLTMVVRAAGGIAGATIIIEHPPREDASGRSSGFPDSVLIGGYDKHAGQIGHLRVTDALIEELDAGRPPGLGPLEPYQCSCVEPSAPVVPKHLEAYASAGALAHRVAPDEPMPEVLERVLAAPDDEVHRRALDDVGVLIGEALLGPVAMLNPGSVVLTGALAPEILDTVDARIADAEHPIHTHPDVRALSRDQNKYVRVQGAALAVLREHVHRQLAYLVGVQKRDLEDHIRDLTLPLSAMPWERR